MNHPGLIIRAQSSGLNHLETANTKYTPRLYCHTRNFPAQRRSTPGRTGGSDTKYCDDPLLPSQLAKLAVLLNLTAVGVPFRSIWQFTQSSHLSSPHFITLPILLSDPQCSLLISDHPRSPPFDPQFAYPCDPRFKIFSLKYLPSDTDRQTLEVGTD